MLGIHVRKQALNDLGRRASISDPRSAATNSWVTTPPGSSRTVGTRSCRRTGPAIPFILPDSRRTYKLTGVSLCLKSSRLGNFFHYWLVEATISDHGEHDVESAAGKADDRGVVFLAFSTF